MSRGKIGKGPRRCDRDRRSRRCRAPVRAVAMLVVSLASLTAAEPARAGDYVIRSCSVPGHRDAPLAPWQARVQTPNMAVVDGCAAGSGVGFRFVGVRAFRFAEGPWLEISRPRSGPQSQIEFVKVSLWYAARLVGSVHPLSVYSYDSRPDDLRLWMVTGAPGAESLSFEQPLSPETNEFSVHLACAGVHVPPDPPPDPCVVDDAMPLQVRGMEVTLRESTPPTVLPLAGTLLASGPESGVGTVSYAASDPHSGLAKVEVLLGDTVVRSHDLAPRCFYSDLTVCPAADDDTLEVDTRAVPNGSYDLALRVHDAAGNERMVHGAHPVEVANELPSGSSGANSYKILANFKGSSRSTLTVPYGQRVSLGGRVMQGSQALGEAVPIQILERPDRRGSKEKLTRTATTKADGSFSVGLATSRPSRLVRVAYRPAGGGEAASKALRLRVQSSARVRATLRGRVVRFSGTVFGAPVPKMGKRIQMEGRSPGSAWTPFKILRTDRKGRFSGTYRLRVRRPGVRLNVRAVVPSERGYGYLGSKSRAVTLRVR